MFTNQQSFYLKSGLEELACTALTPPTVCGAALMLPPFAEERKGALPLLLETARRLYEHNIASLIFDWRGSGDSSGEFESVNPDDFQTDFHSALNWLKENNAGVPITAVGVRLSATYLFQSNHAELENLILISPTSGDEFMRQLLQRRMVNDMVAYGKAIESRSALLAKLKKGESVDLDGYIFSARMYAWAEKRLELEGRSSEKHTARHGGTLLIPGGHSGKTAAQIAAASENVESVELRFPPFWNTVGHMDLSELVERVTQWLSRKTALKSPEACSRRVERPAVSGDTALKQRENQCAEPNLKSSNACMTLLDIKTQDAVIRAAMHKPSVTPKAGVLFMAGWSGDRTGAHRVFVQLARRLTAAGYLCLRPDFRGRGLSDGRHETASIISMAEDADIALRELRRQLPEKTPIYAAAICSGCKVAITLASRHPEIEKMLLLSAESMGSLRSLKTDSHKTKKALKTYLKKLTQLETWKKIITGKVQTKMVTKALVKHETRSSAEAKHEDQTLKAFAQFSNPVHFVFGGSDPDAPGSMAAYKAYCEKNSIPHTLRLIPNAGHSYYSAKWKKEVFETSLDFLTQRKTPDESGP